MLGCNGELLERQYLNIADVAISARILMWKGTQSARSTGVLEMKSSQSARIGMAPKYFRTASKELQTQSKASKANA